MTELKDILPVHFEKIGFDIFEFFEKSNRNINKCKINDEIDFFDEYCYWQDNERESYGEIQIDYATILTSKQYIDCLAGYIWKKCEMRENDSGYKNYNYKKYSFFNELDVLETVIEEIGKGLYGKHVADFISYITNDE